MQLVPPRLQKILFGRVHVARDRARVGGCRLRVAAEAAKKIGAYGVKELVAIEVMAMRVKCVDDSECDVRTVHLADRDRAIERDDRARHEGKQLIVQLQDLTRVPCRCRGRVTMDGVDGGLDLIRARPVAAEAVPDAALSLANLRAVRAR